MNDRDKKSFSNKPSRNSAPSTKRAGSSSRPGAPRQDSRGSRPAPVDRDMSRLRPRIFEPDIPEEVTGEELEKTVRAELPLVAASEVLMMLINYFEQVRTKFQLILQH